jgi:hypothetical protein
MSSDPSPQSTQEYGLNVSRFLRDHPGHILMAAPDGEGFSARRKNGWGHGTGGTLTALTLDELDRLLRQEQRLANVRLETHHSEPQ